MLIQKLYKIRIALDLISVSYFKATIKKKKKKHNTTQNLFQEMK